MTGLQNIKKRLIHILDISPELKSIFLSKGSIEEKREKIRNFLSTMLFATFDDDPTIPSLEWVQARDSINTFKNIISKRSERIAGFSLIEYINELLHTNNPGGIEKPHPGFFAELEHLLKGIMGKSNIYPDRPPAFLKYEGVKAARLRSADLSRMGRNVKRFLNRYTSGLESSVIRKRSLNKRRILKFFGATELEWEDWRWHVRNTIKDEKVLSSLIKLSPDEYTAVKLARENRIPFGITPYYLSLMDYHPHNGRDRAIRAQVIPSMNYVKKMKRLMNDDSISSLDFMMERDTMPIEGITRRYPMIIIIKPVLTCPQICVYCQRNWEIKDLYSEHKFISSSYKIDKSIKWLKERPEINEVLITGGDPFLMNDSKIESILNKVSKIEHIERIRIGTRTPVTLPQRITDDLARKINRFHKPGKREIVIVTHFEHPYEITPQSMSAVQKFKRYGIDVYNQMVFTYYNSRRFEASALRHNLRLIGVTPYYTFNTKGKEETEEYRVPIPRLMQEQKEEARLLPGMARTDKIVFNIPRLGKNYLQALQHRDVITILPDGRRMYEFHPWEKNISLVNTYIYTDTPIYGYLKRLKADGEDISLYKTIWYYY